MASKPHAARWLAISAAAALILLFAWQPWATLDDAASPGDHAADRKPLSNPEVDETSAPTPLDVVRAPSAELPPPVDLGACDLDLFGVVVDVAGAPIGGADVETFRFVWRRTSVPNYDGYDETAAGPSTRTAVDGTFALRLRRGQLVALRVSGTGYGTVVKSDCLAGESVRIVLAPAAALEVLAKDESGAPVAGASVKLQRRDSSSFVIGEGVTDAAGLARFEGLAPGACTVICDHQDYFLAEWTRAQLASATAARVEVTLPAGRPLRGRVFDKRTGAPIAGARIGMNWTLQHSVYSDAEGRYRLPAWKAWSVNDIQAIADGYARNVEQVSEREIIDFEMSRADAVHGRILGSDGRCVAGAIVATVADQLSGGIVRSEADGTFRIGGLIHGLAYTLFVDADGHGRYLLDFEPLAVESGTIELGDVLLPSPRAIEGIVIDERGEPMPFVPIAVEGWNADRMRLRPKVDHPAAHAHYGGREQRRTDDLGRFRFPDQSPGEYRLILEVPGRPMQTQPVTLGADADATGIVVRAGGGHDLDVRVVTELGAPVEGRYVTIYASAGAGGNAQARTDAAGLAVFRGLPDTRFEITMFDGSGGLTKQVRARPSDGEVQLVLFEPAEIAGRVVDAQGDALKGFEVRMQQGDRILQTTTGPDGEFHGSFAKGKALEIFLTGNRSAHDSDSSGRPAKTAWRGRLEDVVAPAKDLVVVAREVALDRAIDVIVVGPDRRAVPAARAFCREPIGRWPRDEFTGADGRYRFEGLEDAPHTLYAEAPAANPAALATSAPVEATPGGGPITLTLRAGSLVKVLALDVAGAPVARASLVVDAGDPNGWIRRTTDKDGRAEFVLASGATGTLDVSWQSKEGVVLSAHAEVNAGGEIVLRLVP